MQKKPSTSPASPNLKRVYDPAEDADGLRVLVDRLWPRGLSRERARVDLWLKDVSPSDDLRRRFHARPEKFKSFRTAYAKELSSHPAWEAVELLRGHLRKGPVTLLFAASDEKHNNAVALAEWLASPQVNPKSKDPRAKRDSKKR